MRQVAHLSEGGTQMFAENRWEAERGLPVLSLQRPLALGPAPGQRRSGARFAQKQPYSRSLRELSGNTVEP